MLYGIFLVFHIIVCITLVLVVLLQAGKGGGLAGAFGGMGGGGAGQSLFGGRGAATFLSKATTVLGVAFMTTSLSLALLYGGQSTPRSILRDAPVPETSPPPVSTQPLTIPGTEPATAPGLIPGPPAEEPGEGAEGAVPGEGPAPSGGEAGSTNEPGETPPDGNR